MSHSINKIKFYLACKINHWKILKDNAGIRLAGTVQYNWIIKEEIFVCNYESFLQAQQETKQN